MTRSSSLRAAQQPVVSREFDATLGFPGEGPSELTTLLVVAYADASFDAIGHHVELVEAESPQGSRTQRLEEQHSSAPPGQRSEQQQACDDAPRRSDEQPAHDAFAG